VTALHERVGDEEVWTQQALASEPALRQPPGILGPRYDLDKTTVAVVGFVSMVALGIASTVSLVGSLLVIIGVVLAFGVLRYPTTGAYALALGVPVLSGLKRGVPVPGLRPSEALVVVVAMLVLIPARQRDVQRWAAIDWLGFTYASASVVIPIAHLIARGQDVTLGAISSMLLPLQFFLLYRTIRTALPNSAHRRMALRLMLFASIGVAFLAALQQFDIGPTRDIIKSITSAEALDSYGYSVYARATGPFQHWHPLAGYLTVIILVGIALLLDDEQRVMSRRGLFVVLAAAGSALMLSVTFVSMIGVMIGAALLGLWAGKLRRALFWSGIVTVIALTLFGSFVFTRIHNQYVGETGARRESLVPQTIENRINVWSDQYIPGLSGRWAAGWGPDLPPDVAWEHTESVYITLLLRGGLPLLFLFGASMIAVSRAARGVDMDRERRPLARTVVALVAVLWLMQLLYPYFTSSGLPQPFWVLVAITFAGWQNGARPQPELSEGGQLRKAALQ